MANVRHYRIILSRAHSPVYQSGETVRGLVSFDVEDAQGIQALRVIARGTCANRWGETEEIFSWSTGLLGSGTAPHAALLRPEHHSHPFMFTLPTKCPSSYSGDNVRIKYSIKAELYPTDEWQERKDFWVPLAVLSPIDINLPPYLDPVAVFDRITSDCCAEPYEYTGLDICTDRQGYFCGEPMLLSGILTNGSKEVLQVFVTMCQEQFFQSPYRPDQLGGFSSFTVLESTKMEDILPCSQIMWTNRKILVPKQVTSSILECHSFKLNYYAEVIFRTKDNKAVVSVKIPFIIGTVPSRFRGAYSTLVEHVDRSHVSGERRLPPDRNVASANMNRDILPPRAASPGPPAYDDLSVHAMSEGEPPPAYDEFECDHAPLEMTG